MKKFSANHLDKLESTLLNHNLTKDIDVELAQEYMMVDLYSGYSPEEATNGFSGFPLQETRMQQNNNSDQNTEQA